MERLGLIPFDYLNINNNDFKKKLLLFDKLICSKDNIEVQKTLAESWIYHLKDGSGISKHEIKSFLEEIEFLEKKGLIEIIDTKKAIEGLDKNKNINSLVQKIYENRFHEVELFDNDLRKINDENDIFGVSDVTISTSNNIAFLTALEFRIYCSSIPETNELTTPIFESLYNCFTITEFPDSRKAQVMTVVLNLFPFPTDETTWEQILEFKSDADSKRKLIALKVWMSEISTSKLTVGEIEEKTIHLLNEYKNQMSLHKLKLNKGRLEVIVVTALEALENIATLKFSKAAKVLFEIGKEETELLLSETTSIGKELAYIEKAESTFGT